MDEITILTGDARTLIRDIPDESVDMISSVLLHLSQDILLYLLFDQEIRKVEP